MAIEIKLDTLKKLPLKYRAYILLGVLVLISGLYWYFIYRPKSAELQGLTANFEKLQTELNESRALAADLPKFKEEVARLDEELKKALLELPNKKEIPSLLTSISNMGTDAGLEFIRFKPLNEVPSGFYAKVPVEINVKGAFHQVVTFFDKVSKLPRIVNITEVSMGGTKEERGRLVLTASCLATTYRFIEGEGAKK